MRTDLFDFDLPPERIALRPVVPRDAARLLVVRPGADAGARRSRRARSAGPAARGRRARRQRHQGDPGAAARPAHRPRRRGAGDRGDVAPAARRRALARLRAAGQAAGGRRRGALRRRGQGVLSRPARRHGRGEGRGRRGDARLRVPRAGARPGDRGARRHAAAALHRRAGARPTSATAPTTRPCSRATEGSVAAPTAGLHFTDDAGRPARRSAASRIHTVTLHVGAGTFLPVKAEDTAEHRMHAECGQRQRGDGGTRSMRRARAGGRIVAVGSTSLRLLESATRRGRRRSARSRARPRCSSRRAIASAPST